MSDWEAGDLAVLVKTGWLRCPFVQGFHTGKTPKGVGVPKQVTQVAPSVARCGCLVLYFADGSFGISLRYHKIRPHTPDAEDAETIRIMRGEPATTEPVSLRAQHGAAEVDPFPCASAAEVSQSVHEGLNAQKGQRNRA